MKNNQNILPLSISTEETMKFALIGPNANNTVVMKGTYYGLPPFIYSVYQGLLKYVSKENIDYEMGCEMDSQNTVLLKITRTTSTFPNRSLFQ